MKIELIGGPTALIEIGGLHVLTDPTFDPPGEHPVDDRVLVKTVGPSRPAAELGRVDLVLLSHDQHPDNFDDLGRAFVKTAPLTISTMTAAGRVAGNVRGLEPWRHIEIPRPDGGALTVYGVPAQHGPDADSSAGPVIGFVLAGEGVPTVYVSGDNASLRVVEEVQENLGPIDIALLFVGAARTSRVDAYVTLTARKAARAAVLLDTADIVPVHCQGWAHLTQGLDDVRDAFGEQALQSRLHLLAPGDAVGL